MTAYRAPGVPPAEVYDQGACHDTGTAVFFPDEYTRANIARAAAVCDKCPVYETCRGWAVRQGPALDGIWAGMSPADRQKAGRADGLHRGLPPTDARHGTETGYHYWGCRCDPCREAASQRQYQRRTSVSAEMLDPDDHRHGTSTGYTYYRCRCDRCRASHAAYMADLRQRQGVA